MKVSLNTIKQYIDFELPPVDELVKRINEQLGGVEEVIDLGAKYKDAVIVKVVACEKHPNADRLNVTKIDDGGVVADVPRDENGYVQVVCGAPNVHADMFAVWLPPKSTVPASFDDAEPFVLDARELRGVLSQGMLAAGDELAINGDHEGIIEINPDEWKPNNVDIKPGTSFAKVYGLDDTIIDIENKMFTHRPDLFGQLGVAREIAGILGHKFTSPEWYVNTSEFSHAVSESALPLEVFNDAPEKVPRFMAVALKNIEIKPSPLWLQVELMRLGSKAINNIVDVTNYVMLLTAQPTHAYDYDKLRGHKLGARMAKQGEKITLLNHKTYELTSDDIVIADGEGPVGLAGIMGGGDSEVDENTKNIVLEVANFDMYTIRKSSMRHGVFTDALTRFNKGQSPLQNPVVMNLLMQSIKDVAGGEQASDVFDQHGELQAPPILWIDASFVNERLGLNLSGQRIADILKNTEFDLVDNPSEIGDRLDELAVPFWRTDIEQPEDIVEEVGRLYGFDKLPRELPQRSIKPAPKNLTREVKQKLRETLQRAGANEVLTYSFVHENVLKKAGQDSSKAFRLSNALSPDLQYYRLSVLPSLLDKVHANSKAGYDAFALFELGKAHHNGELDKDNLPKEFPRIAGVYAAKNGAKSAPFYQAKRLVQTLTDSFGLAGIRYQKLAEFDYKAHDMFSQLCAPFDPERSAVVWYGERLGGVVGELKNSVLSAFKLPPQTAAFELFISLFETAPEKNAGYRPLSRFPSITQDITLKVPRDTLYALVYDNVRSAIAAAVNDAITYQIEPLGIYEPKAAENKNITLRITMTHQQKTMTDQEAVKLLDTVAVAAAENEWQRV